MINTGCFVLDREVTREKLDSMELLYESDAKYLYEGRDMQGLLMDNKGRIIAYLCLIKASIYVYACFLIPSVHINKYKMQAARTIKRIFEYELSKLDWRIVQTVSKDCKLINRWMEFLAFEKVDEIKVPNTAEIFFLWRRKANGC